MLAKTISSYGAPYVDAEAVENPQCEMAASYGNRLMEDVAQLTRTPVRAFVSFVPVAAAAPVAVTVASHWSVWGSAGAQAPTIQKTDTGEYTITWPTTQTDGLSVVETLALRVAWTAVTSSAETIRFPPIVKAVTANTVAIKAASLAGAAEDETTITINVFAL